MDKLLFSLMTVQLIFSGIAAIYFYRCIKVQNTTKSLPTLESKKELEHLKRLRSISLTKPLAEQTRPQKLSDIIGQEQGVKALYAALCGPNPQHILIYGPPGVGKTAAARLILEEAKKTTGSPFGKHSKFIELDATTLRFDERSIADPLVGSVHDPIYQGAGAYGSAGIPQPKAGAVTQAHGGVLFIDEIGEMHPLQMNKLLKILEDRVAKFQSSYYSASNRNIPEYIHEVFQKGLPADFRLIGATTRRPEELPPALRSRCMEIYFDDLKEDSLCKIAENSLKQVGFGFEKKLLKKMASYASNGREIVNMVQMAVSVATMEKRKEILEKDLDWVLEIGRYQPSPCEKIAEKAEVGVVNGLAVYGTGGRLLKIEVSAKKVAYGSMGSLNVTGIVEEEERKAYHGTIRKKSNAKSSVETVMTAMEAITGLSMKEYDIHINFPGGMPVDGPSAGAALFCAVYSALYNKKVPSTIAMTGEISLLGHILAVGGVDMKLEAAIQAGANTVFIPAANWKERYEAMNIKVVKVNKINEILEYLYFEPQQDVKQIQENTFGEKEGVLTAEGV